MMIRNSNTPTYGLAMLLTLYLAQGLPSGFMTQALPVLLRHYGVSLTQIGFSGLLMMPWALKFLWSPYVDLYGSTRLGHYRSWILLTQSLTIVCLLVLAFLPIKNLGDISTLWGMFVVLLVMNTLCATQDVATDGLAVNLLKHGAVHWGNTFQVMGSRLGFILGGGAILYAIDLLSWQTTFLLLAAGVAVNSILIVLYKEPNFKQNNLSQTSQSQSSIQSSENHQSLNIRLNFWQNIQKNYGYLWSSKELRLWMWVVLTYKLADGIVGPILKPMMVDIGLNLSQIGIYVTMTGAICAVIGALLAGWLIKKFTLKHMFIVFSILQTSVFVYYILIARAFENGNMIPHFHLYFANALEEFCAAMSLVAMLSLVMTYSRPKFAATDFTIQVALMSIIGGGLYTLGGVFADFMGYSLVLYTGFLISFACLLPKFRWAYMNKFY